MRSSPRCSSVLLSLPGWMLPCALPMLADYCEVPSKRTNRTAAAIQSAAFTDEELSSGNFCELRFLLGQFEAARLTSESGHFAAVSSIAEGLDKGVHSDTGILSEMEGLYSLAVAFGAPAIYRGQIGIAAYAAGAMRTCSLLRDQYGGPPCDAQLSRRIACRAATGVLNSYGLAPEVVATERAAWMRRFWSLVSLQQTPPPCHGNEVISFATNPPIPDRHPSAACMSWLTEPDCADVWRYSDVLAYPANDTVLEGMECPTARDLVVPGLELALSEAQAADSGCGEPVAD
jgi:hypothetical protein